MKEHKKKLIAPIVVTVIIGLYYIAYFVFLLALLDGIWKWLLGIIPLAFTAIMQGAAEVIAYGTAVKFIEK